MNRTIKIAITGPESSGKTTLARDIAKFFNTTCIEEYAREYLAKLGRSYNQADLKIIAEGQLAAERNASNSNKVLICDSDLRVIQVWSEIKYNTCDYTILNDIALNSYDLTILTTPDFEWEPDPLREHPSENDRKRIYQHYKELVTDGGAPMLIVSGPHPCRMKAATGAISALLGQNR